MSKFKLNPLTGDFNVVPDSGTLVQKLNPVTGDFNLTKEAGKYKQVLCVLSGEFNLRPAVTQVIVHGVGSVQLTNAVENGLLSLKAYGGTEQRNLPKGFTQYEYLRSNGTQYIDLGYKGNGNTKVEVKFKYHTTASATGSGRVFGSRITSSNNAFAIGTSSGVVSDTNNKVFRCYDGQPYYVDEEDTFGLDVWQTVIFSATEHKINGVTEGDDYEIVEFETPSNLSLFGFDNNGTIGVGYVDIAYCKLWDNGVLVRDLIPCKNSSNVFGMYDRVSETLLTNAGTGTFGTGNTATPTPEKPMNIVSNNGALKYSSNLFKVSDITTSTVSDVTVSASSDGTITANGTSSSPNYSQFVYALSNPITEGTYTVSLYNADTLGTGSLVGFAINTTVGARGVSLTSANNVKTITVGSGETCNNIIIRIAGTANNFKFKIQIEKGSEATPYHNYGEVYTDGTTETVNVHRKNLFDQSTATRYKTAWSNSGNGAWQVVLSSSEAVAYGSYVRPNTTYTLSKKGGSRLIITGYRTKTEPSSEQTTPADYKIKTDTTEVVDGSYTFTTPADCTWILFGLRQNNSTPTFPYDVQLELGSTATTYEPYYDGGAATAEMLLKVGDNADEQEMLSGNITRRIGVKVFDGTENWQNISGYFNLSKTYLGSNSTVMPSNSYNIICSHFKTKDGTFTDGVGIGGSYVNFKYDSITTVLADWKTWLADQYNAGTPVIVVYPLATPTTESVAGQTMNIPAGDSTIGVVQASLDNLELEATYEQEA